MMHLRSAILAVFLFGCSGNDGTALQIEEPRIPATPAPGNAALYFSIVNNTSESAELISVHSDVCERIEIHKTIETEGRVSMQKLASLAIEPGTSLSLEPGGLHIMFIGLKNDLEPGQTISIELKFQKSRKTIEAMVLPAVDLVE